MLTKNDLQSIKEVVDGSIEQNNEKIIEEVKDIVDFAIEKSEIKMETMMDRKIITVLEKIDREVTDLAETNREFLKKFDNHERRITKLEINTGIAK